MALIDERLERVSSVFWKAADVANPTNIRLAGFVSLAIWSIALAIAELAQAIRDKSFV